MNPLDRVAEELRFRRLRSQMRRLRYRLSVGRAVPGDYWPVFFRQTAEIWNESGDVDGASEISEAMIRRDAEKYGISIATVLMLIELAVLIYRILKHLGMLKVDPKTIDVISEME